MEHFPKDKTGLSGSLIVASCAFGVCISVIISKLVMSPSAPHWLWRVAYIVGALLGLLGYYIRNYLSESKEFQQAPLQTENVIKFLRNNRQNIFLAIGLSPLASVLINTTIVFLGLYLNKFAILPIEQSFEFVILALLCFVVSAPTIGIIADKIGSIKTISVINLLIIILTIPIFYCFVELSLFYKITSIVVLSILAAGYAGVTNSILFQMFPVKGRYKGMALSFNIAMAIFGGTAPLICFSIIDFFHDKTAPGYFLSALALLSLPIIFMVKQRLANQFKHGDI